MATRRLTSASSKWTKKHLNPEPTVNYSAVFQPYGFDVFSAGGDIGSAPRSGFNNDPFIAGESVRWLRETASEARRTDRPFFMVASFVNPHAIMFGNGNIPGQPPVQIAVAPQAIPPPPESSTYQRKWSFTLPPSLQESLTAPGMPAALSEYKKGWDGWSGAIPEDRKDMWSVFYNYYLNSIRDEDSALQQLVDVMNEMDLWRYTVVVFTADHGEIGRQRPTSAWSRPGATEFACFMWTISGCRPGAPRSANGFPLNLTA